MKIALNIFLFTLLCLNGIAQNVMGLKINLGASMISNSLAAGDDSWTTQIAPTGNLGIYYARNLGDNIGLGTEILFDQVEGKFKIESQFTDINGDNIGSGRADIWYHISYLAVPLYLRIKSGDWTVNAGIQGSLLLSSGGKDKGSGTVNGDPYEFVNKYDKLYIDPYNIGIRAGLDVQVNERIELDAVAYYGLNNIIEDESFPWVWRVTSLTFGIKYSLINSSNEDKE